MNPGLLYVVATPIGNLADISRRAISVLSDVDLILAEDTRHCRKLLQEYGIKTHVRAFHEHNEEADTDGFINQLLSGTTFALISDAGTPLINDPGYPLVKAAHDHHITLVPIPGPCAATSALSVCGLPTDRFVYEGFLPNRRNARLGHLTALENETRTMVFYESTHRITDCLVDMINVFGSGRQATLAKEMTKQHEKILRDSLSVIHDWLLEDEARQKGEFVLVVSGNTRASGDDEEALRVLKVLLGHLSVRDATSVAAEILGENKNTLYDLAIKLQK